MNIWHFRDMLCGLRKQDCLVSILKLAMPRGKPVPLKWSLVGYAKVPEAWLMMVSSTIHGWPLYAYSLESEGLPLPGGDRWQWPLPHLGANTLGGISSHSYIHSLFVPRFTCEDPRQLPCCSFICQIINKVAQSTLTSVSCTYLIAG